MKLSDHPHWPTVQRIYHTLVDNGYKAYLAGGCVRDFLLGRTANDLDIATDATPDTIERLFPKTVAVGKAFGVILVVENEITFEVATFRSDGAYVDGRHPEAVVFTTAEEDAERRDFTVNALFYDLHQGRVLDFVGGVKDLEAKTIKAVGDPEARFREDHLRLFRAVRFSAQLDFEIEPATLRAVKAHALLVKTVSPERIHEETYKLLKSKNAFRGLELLESTGLGKALFPGWSSIFSRSAKQLEILFADIVAPALSPTVWGISEPSSEEDANSEKEARLWMSFLAPWALSRDIGWTRILDEYRFSRSLNKNLRKALERLENTAHFFSLNPGEQLVLLGDPSVHLFLAVCEKLQIQTYCVNHLKSQWQAWGRKVPEALVRAADVKDLVQGRDMGSLLHACLVLQLGGNAATKEALIAQGLKILKI